MINHIHLCRKTKKNPSLEGLVNNKLGFVRIETVAGRWRKRGKSLSQRYEKAQMNKQDSETKSVREVAGGVTFHLATAATLESCKELPFRLPFDAMHACADESG